MLSSSTRKWGDRHPNISVRVITLTMGLSILSSVNITKHFTGTPNCIEMKASQTLGTDSIKTDLRLTALEHSIREHSPKIVTAGSKNSTMCLELSATSNKSHIKKLSSGSQKIEAIKKCIGMWRRLKVNHSEPWYSSITVPRDFLHPLLLE
ncbi:hypothetical protein HPB52_003913 [Rhipicephalus sanguineus]|uniref:Uncharacterized protein n=1 Tax=Rhipicephalus sanguineus TaxID=34632 RepID=A0A9D4QKN8_RHISA|nr:hypothetical protein HPB52_003913 [Rhipicephalus sanguineus]